MFKVGNSLDHLTKINSAQRFPTSESEIFSQLNIYPELKIESGSKIFTIGSCFARNIEEALSENGFDVPMLSFSVPEQEWPANARRNGILNRYSPQNIYQTLKWLYDSITYANNYHRDTKRFMLGEGMVIDADLSGFIPVTEDRFWSRRQEMLSVFKEIQSSDYIIITLGQTEAWYFEPNDVFWSRLPVPRETRQYYADTLYSIVDLDDAKNYVAKIIKILKFLNPKTKIVFTVSPVAADTFWQDGNALMSYWQTKSTLLQSAKQAVWTFDDVYYFPSFEAVHLIEDAWDADKMHVSSKTVSKVVSTMIEGIL